MSKREVSLSSEIWVTAGAFLRTNPVGITSALPVIREKSRKGQETRPFYHLIICMKKLFPVGTSVGAATCRRSDSQGKSHLDPQ